jgi:hypothetical protein
MIAYGRIGTRYLLRFCVAPMIGARWQDQQEDEGSISFFACRPAGAGMQKADVERGG